MFLFLDFYDFISLTLAGSDPQIKLPGETNQNIEQAGKKVQVSRPPMSSSEYF